MADLLELELVTPQRRYLADEVEMVVVPGEQGAMGMMAHHAALIAMMRPGLLEVYRPGGAPDSYYVSSGYANIADNVCTVLAETLIPVGELKRDSIEGEIGRLRREIESSQTEAQRTQIERQLLEAETRLALAPAAGRAAH